MHVLQDSHGLPILYAACERGLDRILEKLLDKGADPNAREPVSPLQGGVGGWGGGLVGG